jgi:tRNA dimethylallyltransferase
MGLIPIITGATASGKSEAVFKFLEKRTDYEVISADAFQVYRGLDIGTAKPSAYLLERYPHHLIDILEPNASYSAGAFAEQAEAAVEEILNRGKKPIIAGGTGLYIESLRNGIFKEPQPSPRIRAELSALPNHELYAELSRVDPESAAKIHPNDRARLVRALEVWRTGGIPISEAHKLFKGEARFEYKVYVLEKDREILYRDINERTHKMLADGWLEETENLLKKGVTPDSPSFRAIGYRELAAVIRGELALDKAEEAIAQKTRNFAKRQLTWFRRMKGIIVSDAETVLKKLITEG